MIRFVKWSLSFILLFLFTIELICCFLTYNLDLSRILGINKEYQNILKLTDAVNGDIESDTLFLGDSVGRQLYPTGAMINYVTSTGAVLVHGNLQLLKKAQKNNPELRVLKYIVSPHSLSLDLNYGLATSSYVKPFLSIYNFSIITPTLRRFLFSNPKSLLYLFYTGKFLPIDDIEFSENPFSDNYHLTTFAIESISQMHEFCDQHNIKFILISPPVPDIISEHNRVNIYTRDIQHAKSIKPLIIKYLKSIVFLPRNRFVDDLHFSKKDLKNQRQRIRKIMDNKYNSLSQ